MNKIALLTFCFVINYSFSQNNNIIGNEQYDSYYQRIFYDNILVDFIPTHLMDIYYSKLEEKDIVEQKQVIDTVNKIRDIYIKTRKAKSGYTYINKVLFEYISKENLRKTYKIKYTIKENEIKTKEQIKNLIELRKIKSVVIIIDKEMELIKIVIDG